MAIWRGLHREHPNQHGVLLLLKKIRGKKVQEKVRKTKNMREKNTGKKYGKKSTGKYGGKVRGKVTWLPVMSLPVKHAQWSDPLDSPHVSSTNVAWAVPIYYSHEPINIASFARKQLLTGITWSQFQKEDDFWVFLKNTSPFQLIAWTLYAIPHLDMSGHV